MAGHRSENSCGASEEEEGEEEESLDEPRFPGIPYATVQGRGLSPPPETLAGLPKLTHVRRLCRRLVKRLCGYAEHFRAHLTLVWSVGPPKRAVFFFFHVCGSCRDDRYRL